MENRLQMSAFLELFFLSKYAHKRGIRVLLISEWVRLLSREHGITNTKVSLPSTSLPSNFATAVKIFELVLHSVTKVRTQLLHTYVVTLF